MAKVNNGNANTGVGSQRRVLQSNRPAAGAVANNANANVDVPRLQVLGTIREFCKANGLLIDRKIARSNTGNEFPVMHVQAKVPSTILYNQDGELLQAGEFQGLVLSLGTAEMFPVGSKINIDEISVGYGPIVDDDREPVLDQDGQPTFRYILTSGGVFEDVDDVEVEAFQPAVINNAPPARQMAHNPLTPR